MNSIAILVEPGKILEWWALKSPKRKVLTSKLSSVLKSAVMSIARFSLERYAEKDVNGDESGSIILMPTASTILSAKCEADENLDYF